MRILEQQEIYRRLADLPDWSGGAEALTRDVTAKDFPSAIALVDRVAVAAEEMDHHPDIDIRWRTVAFALSTHSEGGLTQLDVELAHQISQEAARRGAVATG